MENQLYELFNLHNGEESKEKTLENIKNNISFRGANLWILACAIIVASVGLNVNSTAVIIGAMLISPLMGPIVAAGFALGIYDFDLLKKALRNLLVATVVSLFASTVYFYLSPFKAVQSELLARTHPNIYDILIAFFGGLVGVITVTRVHKGNPIPGVAIATALMPPLCTAGYGLATGHFDFFMGAFFLYCINCTFICIATFVIVKLLKYPAAKSVDIKHQKQVKYGISLLIIILLVPSSYFAYRLYKEQKFSETINLFLENEFTSKGNSIIYKKTRFNANPKVIELAFLTKQFSPKEINNLNKKLGDYGCYNTVLKIDNANKLQSFESDILNEVTKLDNASGEKDKKISFLENQILENKFDVVHILNESKTLFPTITNLSLANHVFSVNKENPEAFTVIIYEAKKPLINSETKKLKNWLSQRINKPNIEIYFKP